MYAQDTTKNQRFYHINYALFSLFIRSEDQRRHCHGIRNTILDIRVFGERNKKKYNQTFAQTKHTGEVHFACVHAIVGSFIDSPRKRQYQLTFLVR